MPYFGVAEAARLMQLDVEFRIFTEVLLQKVVPHAESFVFMSETIG